MGCGSVGGENFSILSAAGEGMPVKVVPSASDLFPSETSSTAAPTDDVRSSSSL